METMCGIREFNRLIGKHFQIGNKIETQYLEFHSYQKLPKILTVTHFCSEEVMIMKIPSELCIGCIACKYMLFQQF